VFEIELMIGEVFEITPFTVVVSELAEVEVTFELITFEVAKIPFTVELSVFVARVSVFVPPAVKRLVKSKGIAATPFTLLVRFVPVRASVFVFTADVVAITPLIVEVIVLVGFVNRFELIRVTAVPATPLTVVVS
jgi:hypothetical protein